MTDSMMKIYLAAKEDTEYLGEVNSSNLFNIPNGDATIDDKTKFAACYAGWLLGKRRWSEFSGKHNFFE